MNAPSNGSRTSNRMLAFAVPVLLAAPLGIAALDLHTFENGHVADAALVNENFEALAAAIALPPAVPYVSRTVTSAGTTTTRRQFVNTNVFVTLPSDGTWFVAFQGRLYGLDCAGADVWWKARVVNERTGLPVNEAFGLNCSDLLVNADATATGVSTTAGRAGDVLRLQFWVEGTSNTGINLGDANGYQSVTAFRLGD